MSFGQNWSSTGRVADGTSTRRVADETQGARRSLGLGPRDEVALFFGYIREYKGLDLLLEAWPAVADARPAARLVVAGDPVRLSPERRGELERWAERLGAVHRFGYVPFSEVARYFAAADALVMPYRHISQSGVVGARIAGPLRLCATDARSACVDGKTGDNCDQNQLFHDCFPSATWPPART